MKTVGTSHRYVSGPHSSDYYLLLDEQSEYILATRLAGHMRGLATASLLEMWIDDAQRHVWYVFEQVATPSEPISIDS
jgi:hypothetical protein